MSPTSPEPGTTADAAEAPSESLLWNQVGAGQQNNQPDSGASEPAGGPLAAPGVTASDPATGTVSAAVPPASARAGQVAAGGAWYTPTSPRPMQPEYALADDLAAQIYVRDIAPDGFCRGSYQIRDYPLPLDADNQAYPIVTEADTLSSEIDVLAQLSGNVNIEQGNRRLRAPQAVLDEQARVAEFPAGVRMDQPGLIMQGRQARVNLNSSEADLNNVQFVLADASLRGTAERLQQDSDGDMTLTRSAFTRCEPGNNGWRLQTSRLEIAQDEVFGTARNATLKFKSIPVFYSPYLKFPVSDERVSGFLFPTLAYSDEDGVDVATPYYFNLAPNYDATFAPRYISRRGAAAELELRHKSRWQDTVLGGAWLPEDDLYNGVLSLEDFEELQQSSTVDIGEFEPADRWLAALDHRGRIGRFRTSADFTSVSDADYFRDLGSDLGISSRIELQRRGEIQYNHERLFVRLWGQRFQRLDEIGVEDYQRLPELELLYSHPLGPLELSLGAKWADFDRDTDGLNGLAAVTGQRTHIEPRVSLPFSWPFGFLTFSAGYQYTSYDLEQDEQAGGLQLVDETPDRSIGVASVDGGLVFERDLRLFQQDLVQTLEPRVYYLWQEFDDQDNLPRFDASVLTFGYQQLFRANRFSGLDRIGDANQASLGVTSRFLSRETGREYFRFSIGEIFYFEDREVTLTGVQTDDERQMTSAIASEVSARLAGNWRLTGNVVWDPNDNEVDEGGAALQYRRDNRHIFNLGFRNRRSEDIEQTDVSLMWPITRQFSIFGRWNYDLVSGRTIEGIGGIEYSDCCLQVRLMARRFLDSPANTNFTDVEGDEGVFLQIVFKGLAGFGNRAESILERGIRGYRAPDRQDYFSNNRDF
ncbi:MAG: LPS-assembly protein LptD [Pseudomonadota bacterium]